MNDRQLFARLFAQPRFYYRQRVEAGGIEPPSDRRKAPENRQERTEGGAKCGAIADGDAELARVAAAWPTLPADVRAAVLAMLRLASN